MNNEIMINKRRIRFTQIGSIILCLLFLTAFGNTYLIQPIINDDARIAKDLVLYNAVSTYATEGPIYDRNGNIISQNSTLAYPENYSYSWLLGYYSTSLGMENVYGLRGNLKDYLYFLLDKDNVGAKVTLTTDSRIQNYAHESILQGIEGSVIVLDNKTGAILALSSQSTVNYDGNDPMFILQSEIEGSQFRRGTYENDPPGSTFKILTSIAALEKSRDEQLDESFFSFNDTGTYIPEGDQFEIRNYNNIAYGQIGLNEALANSVNCYFADLGIRTGRERIEDVAKRFMIGTDIEIPFFETIHSSLIFLEGTKAELAQIAFGQGNTKVTPMNLALIAQAIGNHGEMMQPYLVDHISYRDFFPIHKTQPRILSSCADSEIINRLKEAMHQAALSYGLGENYGMVYAKTGTAECFGDRLHTYILVTTDNYSFVISRNNGNVSTELYDLAANLLSFMQNIGY